MARNRLFSQLVQDLRAEVGHSTSAPLGQSVLDSLKQTLQRTQEFLWEDFDWPFLRTREIVETQAGERFYDLPDNMILERVERMETKYGGRWRGLRRGITIQHYNQLDPVADERSSPMENWEAYTDGQFEVWPLPSQNADLESEEGVIRVSGIRNLQPLIADDDTADLDDRLIVLFAKAEILARQNSRDAELAIQAAQRHFLRLRGRLSVRRRFQLGCETASGYVPSATRYAFVSRG